MNKYLVSTVLYLVLLAYVFYSYYTQDIQHAIFCAIMFVSGTLMYMDITNNK